MRFRTRLLVTMAGTILLSSVLLGWVVRENMTTRFTAQYDDRGSALATTVAARLSDMSRDIDARLDILVESVSTDGVLVSALSELDGRLPVIDPILTEFGITRARMTGLDVIQLQDAEGLIVTSSHNPGEHGSTESSLSKIDANIFNHRYPVLRAARFPSGIKPTLVRLRAFMVGGREYFFTAGVSVDELLWTELTPAADFELCLESSPDALARCRALVEEEQLQTGIYKIDLVTLNGQTGQADETSIIVRQSRGALADLLRDIDRWLVVVFGIILGIGMLSMVWVSGKISDPLADLLYKTSRIDLNRLNVSFKSGRKDEIGDLARVLDEMTRRLRTSRTVLREAERKLAIGEVARQVNHDIKNGLTPIRNIIQHFLKAAHSDDPNLTDIVKERESSLKASINILEELAGNYARLSPDLIGEEVDINDLLSEFITDYCGSRSVNISFEPGATTRVSVNTLALRRILENLLDNAFDSFSAEGSVHVSTEVKNEAVELLISDSGAGMSPKELENALRDFHTTKTNGTGLGLSIVRRLVMDMNASMSINSTPGKGTTVHLLIPVAEQA